MKRLTLALAVLYLVILLIAGGLLWLGSLYWWPVTLLLFAPRWLLAAPLLILPAMMVFGCRRWLPLFVLHLVVLLFPIMDVRLGRFPGTAADGRGTTLGVLTCNVGGGRPQIDRLVALVKTSDADIVLLQECQRSLADQIFAQLGWQFQHRSGLAIGSRCELSDAETIALQGPQRARQAAALSCTVGVECFSDTSTADDPAPTRPADAHRLRVVCIHLPTLRPAIEGWLADPFGGGQPNLSDVVDEHARVSAEASRRAKQWDGPLIVAGDFNMPVASRLFRQHWGPLQNAFSLAGRGYGHTKFTRLHGVRIDHVLASDAWRVVSAEVGPGIGGDHRPVIVRLSAVHAGPSR